MGEAPKNTKYAELNSKRVVPEKFPKWGKQMLNAVGTVAEMFANRCRHAEGDFHRSANRRCIKLWSAISDTLSNSTLTRSFKQRPF